MRVKRVSYLLAAVAATLLAVKTMQPACAQGEIVPADDGRFYIELKDAPLSDALEMIFKAAGNPTHIIDEATQKTNIAPITFNNVSWHSAIRQLANQNNCRFYRNPNGTYVVEPRAPAVTEGGGAMPGIMPTNRPALGFSMRPQFSTRVSPQTRPSAARAAKPPTDPTAADADKDYHILRVNHVYVGGMSRLFNDSSIIDSISFLVPEGSSQGGGGMGGMMGGMGGMMGGMGGMGGMMGGMGGMGGMMGGMGGMGGGFGGGMGGMGGGFGGGMGGMGGFGGGGFGF